MLLKAFSNLTRDDAMLKIGDFSKLARVTVKTLHHYEQMGLLLPAWIDGYSGYRYYALDQLPRLNRILALKDMGFTLEEVAVLLNQELSLEEMRAMLAQKQAELELRLRAEQRRLERVALRLQQIEKDESADNADVLVKPAEAHWVAAAAGMAPSLDQVQGVSRQTYRRILEWLAPARLQASADWFTLHDNPEYLEGVLPIQTAVVLRDPARPPAATAPRQPFAIRELPAVEELASLAAPLHAADIYRAYSDLYAWVEQNGYKVSGPVRERYLTDADEAQSAMIEVQFPITRRRPWMIFQNVWMDTKENKMDLKIVQLPAMRLVGMKYFGKNENGEIPQMWTKFNLRSSEIEHTLPGDAYGVCRMEAGMAAEDGFTYYAALPVSAVEQIPEGMEVIEMPALKCAAFPHVGALESLGKTYETLYGQVLPQSGLEILEEGFDMEYYGSEFDPAHADSIMYIYVPLK
jgi:predicted transcriptional regulator YdeE/DNA-binding transcriptional MerR regulator